MSNIAWTDERIAKLRELWVDPHLSCAKIAHQIGGVTRNAVIGKAKRLGLGPKPSDAPKGERLQHLPPKPKTTYKRGAQRNFGSVWSGYPEGGPEPFVPRAIALPTRALPIEEWTDLTCKYIAGDDRLACGHPTAPDKPYCQAHCDLSYTQPKERTQKQKEQGEALIRQNRTARSMSARKWLGEEAA